MTPTTESRPLDTFESALLTQLRSVVDDRAAVAALAPPASAIGRRSFTPRRLAIAGLVAAAGAGALVLAPSGSGNAYALSTASDGSVTVTIKRLADAGDLVRDLAARGIKADVTYLPAGKMCADGRYTAAPSTGEWMASTNGGGKGSITIPKSMVGSDKTLVLSSSWLGDSDWLLDSGVAIGPVAPCKAVPTTLPDIPPGSPGVGGFSDTR